jgi:transposase
MNVGHSTLDKWVRTLKAEREGSLTASKPMTEEQREIAELKRRVKRLEMEKDRLKKASALSQGSESLKGLMSTV